MSSPNGTASIPPFVEDESGRHRPPSPARAQGLNPVDLIVMGIAWMVLTITLVGGAKVLWDVLSEGLENQNGLWATVAALATAFVVGWVMSLVSIRSMRNIILPTVIRAYMFFIVLGIMGVYLRVVYKLFMEVPNTHYSRYSIVMGSLFLVLMGLHLLLDGHSVFPYVFPLLIAGVIHILGIVVHYVFLAQNPDFIGYDIAFFILNLVLSGLIVSNLFFLKPIQFILRRMFSTKTARA